MQNTEEKGITLISLVITIIVLIILAGVSINLLFGVHGIIDRSKQAKFIADIKSVEEQVVLYRENKEIEGAIYSNVTYTINDKLPLGNKVENTDGFKETLIQEINKYSGNINNLYYIDKDEIKIKQKHDYIIDVETLRIYDEQGEKFFGKYHHTIEEANNESGSGEEIAYVDFEITEYNYMQAGITREGDVVIPETFEDEGINYRVIGIGEYAFSSCTDLTSITIPNSVSNIGYNAFSGCSGLTSITIPNSVTSIGEEAFFNCTGLTSITILDSVTTIGNSAFDGCENLTSVTMGNNVTSIGDYAFQYCKNLTSITIPKSVTSIGDYAFSNCTGLTSITILDSVTTIGNYAFASCESLISAKLGEGVTSIGDEAFSDCIRLTSITIPDSVTYIGDGVFERCEGLISAKIGKGVDEVIDNQMFERCDNLESITIGSNFNGIQGLTYNSEPLKEIIMVDNVTEIVDSAFGGCCNVTSITIADNVTTIGDNAFEGCSSLTSITIPNKVTTIGNSAFAGCSGLTSITIPSMVTSIGDRAFSACYLSSVTYKGIEYTSKTEIENILSNNGVTIGQDAFDSTNLSE